MRRGARTDAAVRDRFEQQGHEDHLLTGVDHVVSVRADEAEDEANHQQVLDQLLPREVRWRAVQEAGGAHAMDRDSRIAATGALGITDEIQMMPVLTEGLPSAPRPKGHYRNRPVRAPYEEPDSFAANEAQLLLSYLAANLMAAAAELLHHNGRPRMRTTMPMALITVSGCPGRR
jgi:hypothetical protein